MSNESHLTLEMVDYAPKPEQESRNGHTEKKEKDKPIKDVAIAIICNDYITGYRFYDEVSKMPAEFKEEAVEYLEDQRVKNPELYNAIMEEAIILNAATKSTKIDIKTIFYTTESVTKRLYKYYIEDLNTNNPEVTNRQAYAMESLMKRYQHEWSVSTPQALADVVAARCKRLEILNRTNPEEVELVTSYRARRP